VKEHACHPWWTQVIQLESEGFDLMPLIFYYNVVRWVHKAPMGLVGLALQVESKCTGGTF